MNVKEKRPPSQETFRLGSPLVKPFFPRTTTMPNPNCASCSLDKNRGKLLKCMHSVCVPCLPKQITFGNALICPTCSEITPPPPVGLTQLQALPDSVLNFETLSASCDVYRTDVALGCDDCVEYRGAVSTCLECKMNYCQTHAEGHPLSRATYQHKLEILGASGSAGPIIKEQAGEKCPLHPTEEIRSFCSHCSQLLCQRCEIIHPSEHNQGILPVSEAASQAKLALTSRLVTGDDGDRSSLDEAFDGVVNAIQDLHTQTEAVSAEVNEYFDGLVAVIRKRGNAVLGDLDQLRSKKLLPLEAQRSRLANTINASSTAKSYLTCRQSDANLLKMRPWLEEVADREEKLLKEDGAPCVSAKLVFTPNTSTDMVDVVRQFGDVADVAVPSGLASLQSPTGVQADSAQQDIPDQRILDTFNPAKCHPDITLGDDNRTATLTDEEENDRCVLGATSYTTGQHDIRIRLDDVQEQSGIIIGMTSNNDPPLDTYAHSPGLSAWFGMDTCHFIPSDGDFRWSGDAGQPWQNGDILHLHLDCQQHTLSAHHGHTSKTHTIHDVIGELRLFVSMDRSGQKVSII